MASYLALILCRSAQRVNGGVNADKCVSMALIHDAHEALIGNVGNSVRSMINDWKDVEVRLFNELQLPGELRDYFLEYRYGLSIEGKIVGLADKLATLIRACMYAKVGYDMEELINNYRDLVERMLSELPSNVGRALSEVIGPILSWCDHGTRTNTLSNEPPK